MFGLMFIGVFAYSLILKKITLNKYKNHEWFDILDENGNITGSAPREICHNGSKLLHPVVHIHIINSKNKLLLQKRAMDKDIQPGKWDTSIGGHIRSGESLINAVIRESKEEQGIEINPKKLVKVSKYIFESDIEKEFVFSFLYRSDDELNYQKSEIDEIKFFSKDEIKKLIDEGQTTPNFVEEFRILTQSRLF
jgi:isopentenyl-diphosphate delta-isomerase type 1